MIKDHKLFHILCSCGLAIGGIYAFNKAYNLQATRKHILPADSSNYFSWKGIRIYYEKHGTGSPIILLHALHPAASSIEWNRVVDRLASSHTVYLLDLPGCGRSEKPKTLFTNFYYVQFLCDFIRIMSLHEVTIVASNLSASVAVMAAAYDPTVAKKLILIDPPTASSLAEVPDIVSKTKYFFLGLPLIGKLIYHVLACRPQIDMYFAERYFYNPFHDNEELVDTYFESAHLGNGDGHYFAASLLGKYLNMNINHALKNATLPIKIIEGSATENADKVLKEWKTLNPSILVSQIEHTRQLPMLEEPEKCAEEILNF